jgi:hypothetical protein
MFRANFLAIMLIIIILLSGCAHPVIKSQLDQLYEKNFEGLEVPDASKIKAEGKGQNFPYASYDDVWDSTIMVLIQNGSIVKSSKDSGIIVSVGSIPPYAFFVEKGESPNIYIYGMWDVYKRVDNPKLFTVQRVDKSVEVTAKLYFDRISTQLYSGEKWKWLKPEGKQ